jgi:hypothetical protein
VHPELRGEETFMARGFTEPEIETDKGTYSRRLDWMANRGTGPHLRRDDLPAKLADCQRRSETGLDAETEWARLEGLDSDAAWKLCPTAPLESVR